jgi:Dyp-type peroxidase family
MGQYGSSGPQLELDDIQGDIVVGLQKDFEWFVFFTIDDAARFKEFARRTLLSRISSAAQVLKQEHELQAHKASGRNGKLPLFGLNIGFTRAGLEKLGIPDLDEFNDSAFAEGMTSRSTGILNDPEQGPYSAREWTVGGQGKILHGVILITGPEQTSIDEIKEELTGLAAASGCRVTYTECGMTLPNNRGHEHFGFVDGVSNPEILDEQLPASGPIWPGEFVFGYLSQDPKDPNSPGKLTSGGPEWTRNGSLMVVRRLVQRVPEFNSFIEAKADALGMDRELFAARIVGRWKSGAPLSITPLLDDPLLGADNRQNNEFDFANDPQGRRCPFVSHIRKAYPRNDMRDFIEIEAQNLELAAKKLEDHKLELTAKNKEFEAKSESEKREFFASDAYTHRVMRRGIPFGPELTSKESASGQTTEGVERGLMFVCYQTSIERQFEYIVKNFINGDPDYKRGPDALVGQNRDHNNHRHVEGLALSYPSGDPHRSIRLDTFVSPTGGGYFFVPSLRAFEEFVAAPNQRPNKGGEMAPFNQKKIEDTFEQARTLFNTGDYEGLRSLMHPAIYWKMLHHSGGYGTVEGVTNFLNANKKKLLPQFDPKTVNVSQSNSDGSQQISGTARWQGSKDGDPEDIQYIFTFQQDTAGRWLLVNVFGHLIEPTLAQALEETYKALKKTSG